jgi:hypothetical protein
VQGESGYGETLEWWGRVALQQTMVAKAMAEMHRHGMWLVL